MSEPATAMQLYCPTCQSGIVSDDIALDSGLAKCRRCHQVFSIREQLQAAGVPLFDSGRARLKPEILHPPPHMIVEEWGSEFTVWWRWLSWEVVILIFVGAFWNGMLAVFYIAMLSDMDWDSPEKWLTLLFPSLHLIVGLGIIYGVLVSLVNSTTVQLSQGMLTVRHGPLPVTGNHSLESHTIDQLYVTRDQDHEHSHKYTLQARLHDGAVVPLITGVAAPEGLLYLERKLEEMLKIADRPMPGEVY